ncbi:MAG: phospholipid carrier-dependent glycosyltransferase [Blastocatellia bacterium]|nr:phospholipid carrier-dependent glycosyltransferase [Blastocatellia bacterium]
MKRKTLLYIFILALSVYTLTSYGGIRCPDSEVVFRVAESIADGNGFEVRDLEIWPGFGVARGKDGKLYTSYPPFESILLAPFIKIAKPINETEWYKEATIPISHFAGKGIGAVFLGIPEADFKPHALRFSVSFFNVVIGALQVLLFWLIVFKIFQNETVATALAAVFGFATMAWHYSGTFMSEPLATLLVLLSFYSLVKVDRSFQQSSISHKSLLISGLSLGLAVATHSTALAFAPFFGLYALYCCWQSRKSKELVAGVVVWSASLVLILGLFGYYNYYRFGSFFQMGHSLTVYNQVNFAQPFSTAFWSSLYQLLFGYGKGLFLFSPVVILGLVTWHRFHKFAPFLSILLMATVFARIIFISCFEMWHAGFCLGPRYLLMIVPFLILPFGMWLKEQLEKQRWQSLYVVAVGIWLCIVEQTYFAIGEIFFYYQMVKDNGVRVGVDLFKDDLIYIDKNLSPLFHLFEAPRAPYLLTFVPLSSEALLIIGALLWLAAVVVWMNRIRRKDLQLV